MADDQKQLGEKNKNENDTDHSGNSEHFHDTTNETDKQPNESEPKFDNKPTSEKEKTSHKEETSKNPKKKYGFRLSPEEQETAYEMKAGMMRKLEVQNAKLNAEIMAQKRMKQIERENKAATTVKQDEKLSRLNAIKLMRMYERRAKQAEEKNKDLSSELAEAQDLARRYRDKYNEEKEKSGNRPGSPNRSNSASIGPKSCKSAKTQRNGKDKDHTDSNNQKDGSGTERSKIDDDDLDDDEAMYKRHISLIAETKAMNTSTTTPIRIQDIIRKSKTLILENEALKTEVSRLKYDNAQLIRQAKQAREDRDTTLHLCATSEAAREELLKRLEREKKQSKQLDARLTRQTSEWVQLKKSQKQKEDQERWRKVSPITPYGAEQRTYGHPVKLNCYMPRYMFPVEQYASANQTL